jgi:serine/threonine-protein kinase SMG1
MYAPAQQRNAYAVSVLKRVRAKLEGRDDHVRSSSTTNNKSENGDTSHRKLSVQDHVDVIIQQACSPDNLAVMYEGWMAWI